MKRIESAERVSSVLCLLSLVSCVSLLIFGSASLLLSLIFFEVSGILIGLALVIHGYYEYRQRDHFVRTRAAVLAEKLAWNQIGLAVTVSAYLIWRYLSIDEERLRMVFEQYPVSNLLQFWPPELVAQLKEALPQIAALSYSFAGVAVLLGCMGMAALYRREGRRLQLLEN